MKAFLAITLALCVSCSFVPTPVKTGKGGATVAMLMGGKGMLNYNADGSMAFTYQQEKSFQQAMQTAGVAAAGYFSYLGSVAKELTTRYQAGQITLQQRDAGLRAVETALINAKSQDVGTAAAHGAEFAPVTIHPN